MIPYRLLCNSQTIWKTSKDRVMPFHYKLKSRNDVFWTVTLCLLEICSLCYIDMLYHFNSIALPSNISIESIWTMSQKSTKNIHSIAVDSVFNDNPPPDDISKLADKKALSTYDSIMHSIAVSFILSTPMSLLKFYPKNLAIAFSAIGYAIMLIVFLYFLVTGFGKQLDQQFVSLVTSAGYCRYASE